MHLLRSVLTACIFFVGYGAKGPARQVQAETATNAYVPDSRSHAVQRDSTTLSLDSLYNALVYHADLGWIQLKDRDYSVTHKDSSRAHLGLSPDFVFSDLDGDGYKDAIGSMTVNFGGSGVFNSLIIFLNKKGRALFAGSYFIGDRERVDSIKVSHDTLDAFLLVHGPQEPLCCPTLHEKRTLRFVKGKIERIY